MINSPHIYCATYMHTGSTLLVNILNGFFRHNSNYSNDLVTKTHNTNFKKLLSGKNNEKNTYIICSERDRKYNIPENIKKRILVIKYDEINGTENDENLKKMIDMMYEKLKKFLPPILFAENEIIMKSNCIERIRNMDIFTESVKDKPFSYYDKFYGIHGHHRNRSK